MNHELVNEMRRLSKLSGNVGRKIERFLNANLGLLNPGLSIALMLSLCDRSKVFFAVQVNHLMLLARDFNERHSGSRVSMVIDVNLSRWECIAAVVVKDLPSGMKNRQELLSDLASACEYLLDRWGMYQDEVWSQYMAVQVLWDVGLQERDPRFKAFDRVMEGDLDALAVCDQRLIRLASVLKPEVAARCGLSREPIERVSHDEVEELLDNASLGQEDRRKEPAMA